MATVGGIATVVPDAASVGSDAGRIRHEVPAYNVVRNVDGPPNLSVSGEGFAVRLSH